MKKIDIPFTKNVIASTVKPTGATSIKIQMSGLYGQFGTGKSLWGTQWAMRNIPLHKNNIDTILKKLNGDSV